jgi:branched-chain amino acid transport system substrate-binding protein
MGRTKWLRILAISACLAMVAVACGDDGDGGGGGGGETADCTWKIGTMGALSGDYATLGGPIYDGIEYAVNEANEAGDVPCTLELAREDSQGTPESAPPLAQNLVQDPELVACVCPYFSGETLAVGDIFKEANILMSGTATSDEVDDKDFGVWFRAVASDGVQGPAAAAYIAEVLQPTTVAVVHDNQDYSKGLADSVLSELGDAAEGPFTISPEETDYSATVSQVKSVDPDVVYYGGYNPQAGQLLNQLREAGVEAAYVSDDGAKDPSFGEVPGDLAEGSVVTCPCADPAKVEGAEDFVQGMQEEYGENAPGTFAADMYDVTTFVVDALSELNGDEPIEEVRQHVIDFFDNAESLEGVAKTYTWEDNGEFVADPLEDIWIYEWSNADKNFVSVGPAAEVVGGG